jgi:hypothetical protein
MSLTKPLVCALAELKHGMALTNPLALNLWHYNRTAAIQTDLADAKACLDHERFAVLSRHPFLKVLSLLLSLLALLVQKYKY